MSSSRLRVLAVVVGVLLLFYWLLRDPRKHDQTKTAQDSQSDSDRGSSSGAGGTWFSGPAGSAPVPGEKLFALEGKVITSDGRPAEAATVRILSRPGDARVSFAPDRQATSDAEGGFTLYKQRGGEYVL